MLKAMVMGALALCGVSLAPNVEVAYITLRGAVAEVNPPPSYVEAMAWLETARYTANTFAETCSVNDFGPSWALKKAELSANIAVESAWADAEKLTGTQRTDLAAAELLMGLGMEYVDTHCALQQLAFR